MNILIPIETINREMDSKLILASYLSGRGNQIYLGQNDALMNLVPKMKEGGLYVGKSIFSQLAKHETNERYFMLKKYNFKIVYLHEEGAFFEGDEKKQIQILQSNYDINVFNHDVDVCVWGNFQKKVEIKRSKNIPIHVTGHPRFDLCKKEWHDLHSKKVVEIKKKYKKFILINSNYVASNHDLGLEYIFSKKMIENTEDRSRIMSEYTYSSKQLSSMVNLVYFLAYKFPKINFIYRPHPSENFNYYKTIFVGIKNIFVEHDGSVLPWILASKLLIHDNCTTAVEATLAGKPVLNYKAHSDKNHDIWLANQMGIRSNNMDEIETYVGEAINDKLKLPTRINDPKILSYLHNFTGNSYDRLLKIINNRINLNKKNDKISLISIKKYFILLKTKNFLLRILKPKKIKYLNYLNQKFYGFQKRDLDERIKLISKLLNKKISHKFYNSQLVKIN